MLMIETEMLVDTIIKRTIKLRDEVLTLNINDHVRKQISPENPYARVEYFSSCRVVPCFVPDTEAFEFNNFSTEICAVTQRWLQNSGVENSFQIFEKYHLHVKSHA